jgi:hypothetical protein
MTARVRQHRSVNGEDDKYGDRHINQGFHTAEHMAAARVFAEGRARSW